MSAKRHGRILKAIAINQETHEGLSEHDGEEGKNKETSREWSGDLANAEVRG